MPTSKIQAIAQCKCPRCREGKVFKQALIKKPFSPLDTHEKCPTCSFRFEIEPGFWWAALYISYAINVAIMITVLVATNMLTNASTPLDYILPVIITMLIFYPYVMRYARILLLHFFASIKYEPDWADSEASKAG